MDRDYDVVGRAIAYVEAHRGDQPTLADVAAHVGLSEHHLQRVFSRWAGVSPKRLLQVLTAADARALLRGSATVLDAAHAAGLSGPGRLHDLMVAVDGATPGQLRAGGEGLVIRHGWCPSPFGDTFVAVTDRGVCALGFAGAGDDPEERLRHDWPSATLVADSGVAARVVRQAVDPLADGSGAPLPVLVKGTNLQVRVWEALLAIPEGRAVTYGDVAGAVGRPDAVRAVASAVGANRVAWLIPCHRVLRRSGALGGYHWGQDRKRAMLAWETARTGAETRATS
ncbi:MAG: methylated-DNA--[protein]-cysteine S-methyltransferase [Acidimicrobiales bacterium]|nr:methylated-DNA--[protein]-cysteine S-methyltransferase [Acidimicrobiales bacterium]